tara:strand:- start:1775 stop:2365 length:591 start_codon:yes stop_codon:yes gene_type:complete
MERLQCLDKNFGFVDVWVKLTVHQQKKETRNLDIITAQSTFSVEDVNRHMYLNIHHHHQSMNAEKSFDESGIKFIRKQEFGRRLQSLLAQKGWNQAEFARKVGIGRDSISTYIRGKTIPNITTLEKMAKILQLKDRSELYPNYEAEGIVQDEMPEASYKTVRGKPDRMWVSINQELPSMVAMKIMQLLHGNDDKAA